MLTAEHISFYREHGYIVVPDLIDKELIAELRQVTRDFVDAAAAVTGSNEIYDIGVGHSPQKTVVRRLKNPDLRHEVYRKVMGYEPLIDIVDALIGPGVRFHHSKLNFKPPGGGAAVEWHQDWAFYPYTNDDLLAVGIMLEDCGADDGPLMVVPGSHKGPIHDHHHNGYFVGALNPRDTQFDDSTAVALTGSAGSVTLHHVRTVHGSRENRGPGTRPLLLMAYSAVDAWPLVENWEFEAFNSRVLRGEPVYHARQHALPVRLPLPRMPDTDSIYDDQNSVRGRSFGE